MKKLTLKAKMYLVIAAVAVVFAVIFSIVNVSTTDANRFNYELNTETNTYTVVDIKNNFRGGIFAKKSITVPATYKGKPVTAIKQIQSSYLVEITVEEGIKSIGWSCFYGNKNLTTVNLPSTITSIDQCAFQNCPSITTFTIPSGVKAIANSCFAGCENLETIVIHNQVTTIGDNAFGKCPKLVLNSLPASVKSIGKNCFEGDKAITSMTLPEAIKVIPDACFKDCSALTTISYSNLTSIGTQAFYACSELTSVPNMANMQITINEKAFVGCKKLAEVYLPASNAEMTVNEALTAASLVETDSYVTGLCSVTGKVFKAGTKFYLSVDNTETQSILVSGSVKAGDTVTVKGYIKNTATPTIEVAKIASNAFESTTQIK